MFTNVGPATSHHSRVRGIHLRRWFDVFGGEEMRLPRIINGSRYVFCYIIWSMIMVIYGNVIYKCYIWFLGMFHPIPSYMTWSSNIGIGRKTNVWFDNVLIQKLIWFGISGQPAMFDDIGRYKNWSYSSVRGLSSGAQKLPVHVGRCWMYACIIPIKMTVGVSKNETFYTSPKKNIN